MSVDQLLLIATVATLGAIACAWQVRRAIRTVDYRTSNDQDAAWRLLCDNPPAIDTQPGTDSDALLDCIAICPDLADFQRLHDAINEAREEKP